MTTIAAEQSAATEGPIADPYGEHRSRLLTVQRVRELSELRPWRPVRDTIINWLFILAAWTAVAMWPRWWVVLLAIPVIGNRYYALFIIGHDGMHRRVLKDFAANDLFCDLFILGPIGAINRINNRNHLKHHRHLATASDPDRHKHACFNKFARSQFLGFLTGVTSAFLTFKHVFVGYGRQTAGSSDRKGYTLRDAAILTSWQAALIIGLTWAIGWWAYPLLWLGAIYVFWFLCDTFRSFSEHSHPESDEKADQHRLITYLANPIERAVFAPMNMNYHTVHHLWPSIPYYNLPQADREIRDSADTTGLEWRRSYLGYMIRYWLALPLDECKPAPAAKPQHGAT